MSLEKRVKVKAMVRSADAEESRPQKALSCAGT